MGLISSHPWTKDDKTTFNVATLEERATEHHQVVFQGTTPKNIKRLLKIDTLVYVEGRIMTSGNQSVVHAHNIVFVTERSTKAPLTGIINN